MDSSNLADFTEIKSEIDNKIESYESILEKLEVLSSKIHNFIKSKCIKEDRVSSSLLQQYQYKAHGYAWFETYRVGLKELLQWYKRLCLANKNTPIDALVLAGGFSEYLIQMNSGELFMQLYFIPL